MEMMFSILKIPFLANNFIILHPETIRYKKLIGMKTFFTLFGVLFGVLNAMANDYTDRLTVTVNGEVLEQQATINITQGEDGKYTLSLYNFCLEETEADGTLSRVGVGNIVLTDREGTTSDDGITSINYNDGLIITAGDDPGIDMWMGPMISEVAPVPIEMVARFNDKQLYCEIHINLEMLAQVIDVVFGVEPTPGTDGIKVMGDTKVTQGAPSVFDLQGRRTDTVRRNSLYIVNGKKTMIR